MPIGTNENEPRLSIDRRTLHTNARVAVEKMASNCEDISIEFPSFLLRILDVHEVFDATPQTRQ